MQVILVFAALIAFAFAEEPQIENGVYVGTDDNLADLIKGTEHVLVEFYAPWCGHCKHLEPEYAKAAQELASTTNIKLVKVDATIHEEAAQQYEVAGFPTIKFFKSGLQSDYNGGRTANEIVAWLKKKSGPVSVELKTPDEFSTAISTNEVILFGIFSAAATNEAVAFLEAAARADIPVYHTFDPAVPARQGLATPSIVVFKKFDDGKVVFRGDLTSSSAINQFAATESLPLINVFTDESSQKIFGGLIKVHVLLFHSQSDASTPKLFDELKLAARVFRGKFLFVTIDIDVEEHQGILDFFKLSSDDIPAVRLVNLNEQMAKFAYNGDINSNDLSAFLNDYLDGKLKQSLNSEKTPADWDAKPVKVLTGENFATVVNNADKDVFVEFYAPWCGHCKELAPVWDALAESFSDHSDVVVAKIDSTANELEEVSIQSFPTLKFFPKGADKTPVDYEGDRTFDGLKKFLEERTTKSGKAVSFEPNAPSGHDHDEF